MYLLINCHPETERSCISDVMSIAWDEELTSEWSDWLHFPWCLFSNNPLWPPSTAQCWKRMYVLPGQADASQITAANAEQFCLNCYSPPSKVGGQGWNLNLSDSEARLGPDREQWDSRFTLRSLEPMSQSMLISMVYSWLEAWRICR